ENLLRQAPCNVLLTGGRFYPPLDVRAEEIISWTEEAEARMERVPPQMKNIARTALLRYAIEQGHTVITSRVIDEAMAIFMPARMAEEESLPGVVTKWSADARDALREVTDAYLRRRAKARVEKYARSRRIAVITCELALPLIEDTVGRDKLGAGWETLLARTKFTPAA